MSEFKQGDMILVGQNNPKEREFVAMDGSGYVCRGDPVLIIKCGRKLAK